MPLSSAPESFASAGGREIALAGYGNSVSWPCACDGEAPQASRSIVDWAAREVVLRRLATLRHGALVVADGDDLLVLGEETASSPPLIEVCHPRLWRRLAMGGALAAAESYLQGDWQCDDLCGALRVFARNAWSQRDINSGLPWLAAPWRWLHRRWSRNTRVGSRRNIAQHYDLSNEFFALMLDGSMAYSANIFASPDVSLHDAALAKFEHICRKLQLSASDHLVEVGCGWGGLAVYAAQRYGCRVTATTISQAQFDFAQRRIQTSGVADRVTLLRHDYRELRGQFDKLVSIEMIEAVGEQYLDDYFRQCSQLLKDDGRMLLQAITMPEQLYERYRRGLDFIQYYIFPGGFLPSLLAINTSLARTTDLRLAHFEDLAPHYATTLARWRENFWRNIDAVRELGMDTRFIRMWHYYLCFCEAGFRERATGVAQMVFDKPRRVAS